ncbi:MAG: RNA pyrophosphohydrolase [Gammaproteobacteria bacterium]|nr:RNA pyrophosphohydrolase [Gammaproteobacteria bacterium]MXX94497.1 RNA pyrophosphohydrolase [Gammaproteobacteria bacterium]MYF52599.1 RNA pyrophosphohydrolase [Gammaproteobacteria bacterium]MYK43229.1 RNA pyrophosphohydrolase [Gammaproteobacteria bacterium]
MATSKYRNGVAIVLLNESCQILVARRPEFEQQWQFPQGGIDGDEDAETAAFREMEEEIGVVPQLVNLVTATSQYYSYQYPKHVQQDIFFNRQQYEGQRLKFFLFQFLGKDTDIDVMKVPYPEFDRWRWVDFWEPITLVVEFKKIMYESALRELEHFIVKGSSPIA